MSRVNKPRAFSLDPKTDTMLNCLLQDQPSVTGSALIRRLIAREYRSHMARKRLRIAATVPRNPEGDTQHEQ